MMRLLIAFYLYSEAGSLHFKKDDIGYVVRKKEEWTGSSPSILLFVLFR